MSDVLRRILRYRHDEMTAGRDPGFCFVAQNETQDLAMAAFEMVRYGPASAENAALMTRLYNHAELGNDPFVLNGLRIYGMEIQVEGSAQVAA